MVKMYVLIMTTIGRKKAARDPVLQQSEGKGRQRAV
jgi:hypothetical protein